MYCKQAATEKQGECNHCGAAFVYTSVGLRKQKFCSADCRTKRQAIQWSNDPEKVAKRREWAKQRYDSNKKKPRASCVCKVCSKPFLAKRSEPASYCSPACRRRNYYYSNHQKCLDYFKATCKRAAIEKSECLMCGSEFSCTSGRIKLRTFCNRQCKVEFSRHVRRAKHSGQYIKFKSVEIFEKYGWTCHLCSKPILKSFEYPDPQSPSLDHIIPLSKGGWHAPWNCRPAHLGCNSRKGDKLPPVLSHKQYHIVT